MKQCKCGSMAINIDLEEQECDVCYWKNKYIRLRNSILLTHSEEHIGEMKHKPTIKDGKHVYLNKTYIGIVTHEYDGWTVREFGMEWLRRGKFKTRKEAMSYLLLVVDRFRNELNLAFKKE